MSVSDYEILRELGVGKWSRTRLAIEKKSGREVVLKLAAADDLAREGEVLSRVKHENVIALIARDEEFLVLEYLRGGTVDAYGALDEKAVTAIAAQLARALAHVHACGYIHRDLKPENVFFREDQASIVLADFGLAAPIGVVAERVGNDVTGTPLFASPEQMIDGTPLSDKSDIYALGVTLYYALSRCLPYVVSDFASLAHALAHTPPVPIEKLVDISPKLAALIAAMLAKKPSERPRAVDVAAALLE